MPNYYMAEKALMPEGWADDVLISVDENGWITAVQPGQKAAVAERLEGPVMPGMTNLHSHAFQRAMAGLTERATGDKDSFWTWRETMYKFLETMGPEDQEAIAAQLYVEMLKSGYTSVGEFHYLHHQPDGKPYTDLAASSRHIIRAAKTAGIGITHLPVLYACGGFGSQPPTAGQRRFISTPEQILDIVASLRAEYEDDPQIRIGLAHHSLRAVTPQMLLDVTKAVRAYEPAMPIHIHVAEQMKEVNDCIAWSGKRPIEWLLENVPLDSHWCIIHATHMTERETRDLARTGAVAGLCPTTEANLGDGLFSLALFLESGGRFGIGSDSHISVNMREELRWLEYGQRLFHQARAVTKENGQPSVGATLYKKALEGGSQALGRATGAIAPGQRADFIVLDSADPALLTRESGYVADALIFASNANPVKHVMAGGQWVVRDFKHNQEGPVLARYKKKLEALSSSNNTPSASAAPPQAKPSAPGALSA